MTLFTLCEEGLFIGAALTDDGPMAEMILVAALVLAALGTTFASARG